MENARLLENASLFINDPHYIQILKKYFVSLPHSVERCTDALKAQIRRELFRAASCNGKYIHLYFPEIGNREALGRAVRGEIVDIPVEGSSRGPPMAPMPSFDFSEFGWNMSSLNESLKDNPYHPGRPCVRRFTKGEPTYRCLTCGLDETCVLCQYCFNPADHEGHQVTVSISQRDSGGVCDCGDSEAWVRSFPCKYAQVPETDNEPIPEEALESIRKTVDCCLDYMLDVFNASDIGVHKFKTPTHVLINEILAKLDERAYGDKDDNFEDKYVLCLWNDQKHSFSDAFEAIIHTTHRAIEFGKMVTERVDSQGRAIVEIKSNLDTIMKHKESMERTGLDNTVRTRGEFFREEMCECIAEWLNSLSKSAICGSHTIAREIIATSLLQPWKYGTKRLMSVPPEKSAGNPNASYIVNRSKLDGPYIPSVDSTTCLDEDDINYFAEMQNMPMTEDQLPAAHSQQVSTEPIQKISVHDSIPSAFSALQNPSETVEPLLPNWTKGKEPVRNKKMGSRVQYLLFFDLRFWKKLRMTLRDIYISVLISTHAEKKVLGKQYADLYPQMSELYMIADREPECSVISSLSTQLYTTPTIATDLIKDDIFTKFLAALYTFFTTGRIGSPQDVNSTYHICNDPKVLKNHRFNQMFHDLEYILNRNLNPGLVSKDVDKISQLCDFSLLFQGLSPLQREKVTHVEYESDLWIYFFNTVPYVLQLGLAVAKGIASCTREEKMASISRISRVISDWAQGAYNSRLTGSEMTDYKPDFKFCKVSFAGRSASAIVHYFRVDNEKISVHHPLHAFLSWMIQYADFDSVEDLRQVLVPNNCVKDAEVEHLELVLDHPIRVLSLLSQIQVGLWVRNGYSVRNQLHHYRDATLRDSAFFRDVFMVQTALVVLPPETAFMTLQQRWSLSEWKIDNLYDESQRMYLLEEFLHYLIAFIVERNHLRGLSEKEVKKKYIEKEIIQCLAVRDMQFSDICKVIPEMLHTDELFEVALSDMATFRPPAGLRDHGIYHLKQEYLYKFDSHYIHFSSANVEEAEIIVKTNISKVNGQDAKTVVLDPPFEPIEKGPFMNISGFTRTISFTRFIHDILQFIIASKSGTQYDGLLGHVLQLLHTAALDDLYVSKALNVPLDESFCSYACLPAEIEAGGKSIAGLLNDLKSNADFKDHGVKIDRIFELLRSRSEEMLDGQVNVGNGISAKNGSDFVMDSQSEADSSNIDMEETEASRRKRLGKQHRDKVLEEMRNQQRMFAEQNTDADFDEEMTDDDAEMENESLTDGNTAAFPRNNCILCRMPDDKSSVFGIMCYVMESNVQRKVPWQHQDWVYEAYGCNKDLDDEITEDTYAECGNESWKSYRKTFRDEHCIGPGFPSQYSEKGNRIITGCGHGIHYRCYKEHVHATVARAAQVNRNTPENAKLGEYLCPLCKALNNTFIPVLWKNNNNTLNSIMHVNEFGEPEYVEEEVEKALMKKLMKFNFGGRNTGPSLLEAQPALMAQAAKNLLPRFQKVLEELKINPEVLSEGFNNQVNDAILGTWKVYATYHGLLTEKGISQLLSWLANSIIELEISLRGQKHPNAMGGICTEQAPLQYFRILRVFTEFVKTFIGYLAAGDGLGWDFVKPLVAPYDLLSQDGVWNPFLSFVSGSLLHGPCLDLEVPEILRIQYVASITWSIIHFVSRVNIGGHWLTDTPLAYLPLAPDCDDPDMLNALSSLIANARNVIEDDYSSLNTYIWSNPAFIKIIYSMLVRQILPFLRQSALFVSLLCGDTADPYNFMGYEKGHEGDKLCDYLGIPHLNSMLVSMMTPGTPAMYLSNLILSSGKIPPLIEYPGVIRLLHLPHRLDEFFSISARQFGEELPSDPALCLYCGATLETQSPSIYNASTGQCFSHAKACSGKLGLFILPKRSSLLLLYGSQGSFVEGPYLDLHGEPDETMRRGRPQYLQVNRYDHFIRAQWLQHGIVSYIARKLESIIDNGGWETL